MDPPGLMTDFFFGKPLALLTSWGGGLLLFFQAFLSLQILAVKNVERREQTEALEENQPLFQAGCSSVHLLI